MPTARVWAAGMGVGHAEARTWGAVAGGPSPPSQVLWAGLDLPPSLATPGAQSTRPSQALLAPSHFFGAPAITPIALFREAKTSQVLPGNGLITTYC